MIDNGYTVDDMQFLAELTIYKAFRFDDMQCFALISNRLYVIIRLKRKCVYDQKLFACLFGAISN